MAKLFSSNKELSKEIDKVLTAEKRIKALIPKHKRYSAERVILDQNIKNARWLKKKFLKEYREEKRDPKIAP